ncbi:putative redox protein [Dyadobacter jejuensis]|uniref:Putative redox protein n=2 Tax=Dyadobacter jejuensis TaxID=1082580 RepID=A0A316AK74_9BACT|nr:putative redox protein [Dyadobacter jejuensis]
MVRVDDAFHFEGTGSSSVTVHTDASEAVGGSNAGVRPMELLLMGLASCSAIDVVLILKKQRQEITDFRVVVEGERQEEEGTKRSPFRTIHLTFKLTGESLDENKINRAIGLSMEKYCSATAQLEALATITYSVEM